MFISKNLGVNELGNLTIGGVDASLLAKEYGTPLYVMDEALFRDNCRRYKRAMELDYGRKGIVCYASKAFCCKEVFKILKEEGLWADVASGGELYTAVSAGFPMGKIVFHGCCKTADELTMALKNKVGRIVVDNFSELSALSEIAVEMDVSADIMLRIKPCVEVHTHELVQTGNIDSKFGFAAQTGEALEAVRLALLLRNINLKGFHCHIGSQILDTDSFVKAAEAMLLFISEVKEQLSFEAGELNLGGGFGIKYTEEDKAPEYELYINDVSARIKKLCADKGLSLPLIMIEPGRSIPAHSGITLYTAGEVKVIPEVRTYVMVDGGLTDNPRYSMYKAKYEFIAVNKASEPKSEIVSIAGKCCEKDPLGEGVKLQPVESGDIIAVLATGAFNYSMSSNYNRFPRPPVVMVRNGKARIIVKGETYEDMIRNDL
ncbi:MAG: diaminopimelate decarboxylase [Oscillospiraceae bacterium]|nr:diaminopimelate decarboxylase [Oscillospiraceae bacterium]